MSIVVYTKPPHLGYAHNVIALKRTSKARGVEYVEEDITTSATIEKLKENHDIFMAPVVALVDSDDNVESFHMGFSPDKINGLIAHQEEKELVGALSSDSSADIWDF